MTSLTLTSRRFSQLLTVTVPSWGGTRPLPHVISREKSHIPFYIQEKRKLVFTQELAHKASQQHYSCGQKLGTAHQGDEGVISYTHQDMEGT